MRKLLFSAVLCLGFVVLTAGADTFKLTDGGSVTGDVVKFDDSGVMIHSPDETYTNVPWAQLSQDSLKDLSANPKIKALVEPFIEQTEAERPPKPAIHVKDVDRLQLPAKPSIFGGLLHSPLGILLLLAVYGANLFAAFEIAKNKLRAPAQVMGLAAVLPIIGPVIFLWLPEQVEKPPEAEEVPFPEGEQTPEQIQIVEASWTQPKEEKKPEPQIFARGKFTFNKRFVETKFANFMGVPKGDALKFTMELKTMKDVLTVENIKDVTPTEVLLETVQRGQMTVPLADIQEIKLNPKTT